MNYHVFDLKKNTNYQISVSTNTNNKMELKILEDTFFGKINIEGVDTYTFNYYNDKLEKINIECRYSSDYDIIMEEHNIRVSQIHVSNVLRQAFLDDLKNAYHLVDYYDDYAPSIFYGIMDNDDMLKLERNKSLKIIVWIGGDIAINPRSERLILKKINKINTLKNVKHIGISSFIIQNLIDLKLPYKAVPFMGVNFEIYKPVTKGPSIYLYTDLMDENRYGREIYTKLMEKYPNINFIVACCKINHDRSIAKKIQMKYGIKYYNKKELVEKIYPQCFIGLRLTKHDGLAATVQELGLLGIKTIHNGNSPSSLNYHNFDDVCKHIDNEMKTIGFIDQITANDVKNFLTINENFFWTN